MLEIKYSTIGCIFFNFIIAAVYSQIGRFANVYKKLFLKTFLTTQ